MVRNLSDSFQQVNPAEVLDSTGLEARKEDPIIGILSRSKSLRIFKGDHEMGNGSVKAAQRMGALFCAAYLILAAFPTLTRAEAFERTSVQVVVKDAETGQPINQAHLTLQFREPGSKVKLQRSKLLSFSAKTNPQGRCRFTGIPKGTIRLIVTAENHQTFGKEFELEQDNQVIEVKLKKPQPVL